MDVVCEPPKEWLHMLHDVPFKWFYLEADGLLWTKAGTIDDVHE